MSEVDFSALLAKKVEDTIVPEPLPPGNYRALVKNFETGQSSKKKTPYVGVVFHQFEPLEDVDQDAWGKFNQAGRAQKVTMEEEFYLTETALFRLKQFLENVMGISTEGRSFADCLGEIPNQSVLLTIGQRMSEDGKSVFAEIKGIAKAA